MRSQYLIALPDDLGIDQLVGVTRDPERTVERTYYDTFDWRLYRAGLVLTHDVTAGKAWLRASQLTNGEPAGRLEVARMPRFVSDLPEGALQRDLARAVDVRALLPLVTISCRVRSCRLQGTGITVDEELSSGLGHRLRLKPRKKVGAKPLRRWLKGLRDEFGLEPGEDGLYRAALRSVGRQPGDYSAKLAVRMPAGISAGEAFGRVMSALLDALVANEEGVREDIDTEFLHEFRVAVRRARSILSESRGVLDTAAVQQLRPELVWLQGVTGRPRDLDVYLLDLPVYAASLPADLRSHLEPLRVLLEDQRTAAYAELGQSLQASRYHEAVDAWRALASDGAGPGGAQAASNAASDRIWRAYRRVARQGRAIGPSTAAVELHELRKRCKRLRYLLEAFRDLYPPKAVAGLVTGMKALQENLGEFQDCEVQAEDLQRFASQLRDEGVGSPSTLSAMTLLVDQLTHRQRRARKAFAATFAAFDTPTTRAHFEELFARG